MTEPQLTRLLGPGSLLQSALRPSRTGWPWAPRRLDAVIGVPSGEGNLIHHYFRDQTRPDHPWLRGEILSRGASAPASITQQTWTFGRAGALHALVPEPEGIVHLVCLDPWRALPPWQRRPEPLAEPGMNDLVAVGSRVHALVVNHGRVRHLTLSEGWREREVVTDQAIGAAALFRGPGGLEAVVAEQWSLVHYRLEGDRWRGTDTGVPVPLGGFDALHLAGGSHPGTLLAVGEEDRLELYHRNPSGGWDELGPACWGAERIVSVSLTPSTLDGWAQGLLQEDESIFHLHRQDAGGKARWMRNACVRLNDTAPFTIDERPSVKLAQISGERDSQPSKDGNPRRTLSRSLTRSGIKGTDLGVHVRHRGADYLFFGDTHWNSRFRTTLDSVARVTETDGLMEVEFHGAPTQIVGGGATMREYDVPLDGFSLGDDLFVFFTSDHFGRHQVMGRSVLTRAADPELRLSGDERRARPRFDFLGTFSDHRFINVSCDRVPGTVVPGFAPEADLLLLWGTGAYRADDVRLAVLDLGHEAVRRALSGSGPLTPRQLGLRYFTGVGEDGARWSAAEADARPLFPPGAHGELSVAWCEQAQLFIGLFMSGPEDPMGPFVILRWAATPWGPWSHRRGVFNWIANGMSFADPQARFIRALVDGTDPVGDNVFREQARGGGAAYAPFIYDFAREGDDLVIRYTLSTWNPYQSVLMSHRLALAELG